MRPTRLLLAAFLFACGDAGVEGTDDPNLAADGGPGGGESPDARPFLPGDGGPGGEMLWFPQAISGGLFANPAAYPVIPVRIAVASPVGAVEVTLEGNVIAASDPDGDGIWIAQVPLAGVSPGIHTLSAFAGSVDLSIEGSVDLNVKTAGEQLTFWDEVGGSATPRLHRVGNRAWITWTDWLIPEKKTAWLREIDGAGRWIGERVKLYDTAEGSTYARAVFGKETIGILEQDLISGTPYGNRFRIVGMDGSERLAPIDLNETGWYGTNGGDIAFDGEAYVMAWRLYDTDEKQVRWMRVEEDGFATKGPVVVADKGDGFDPSAGVSIEAIGDVSLIAFVRHRWSNSVDSTIPKSQMATVRSDGTLLGSAFLGIENDYTWHREAKLFRLHDRVAAVWGANELSDDVNPDQIFFATVTDTSGKLDPSRGEGERMVTAIGDRDEPVLIAHPEHHAVLAWTDQRSKELAPPGRIQLFAAPVDEDLTVGTHVVFEHARFIASVSDLTAANAGTNVVLLWRDERHGSGLFDPKPELWWETAWY